jgi:small-conductance mechanosensitive channel
MHTLLDLFVWDLALALEISLLAGSLALAVFLGMVLAPLIIGLPLKWIFKDAESRQTPRFWWEHYKGPARFLFTGFFFALLQPMIVLDDGIRSTVGRLLGIWFILSFAWLGIRTVSTIKELVLRRYDASKDDNLEARKIYTQFGVIQKVLVTLILTLAGTSVLMSFEPIRQLGVSLLASAGVAGIILGFAAQKSIANIFAGLQIAITQPIRLDDVVIVEGEWGWIEEINLTYVVVKIWDERRLILPISYFIEKPFQNWTRTSAQLLGTVFLYTDYRVPLEPLRAELSRILASTPLWDGRVDLIQITNATERTMEVRVLLSSATSPNAWNLRCLVREKLLIFLQENYPDSLPRARVELFNREQVVNPEAIPLDSAHAK